MDLFDEFFDQFIPVGRRVERVKKQVRQSTFRATERHSRRKRKVDKKFEALEGNVAQLSTLLGVLLQAIEDKGLITKEELMNAVEKLNGSEVES